MIKCRIFFIMLLIVSLIGGKIYSETIFFEDFENSSELIFGGCNTPYWGITPLSGTASYPSNFTQGISSQSGNIFYGSHAKETSTSPPATITVVLPDLSAYGDLIFSVALAAADRIFEPTHRDSLHILFGTTESPPELGSCGVGCIPSGVGVMDSFLPITYPDDLASNVYSMALGPKFQDFAYNIDNNLKSLTFAFASSAAVEVVGIDSLKISGSPVPEPTTLLLAGIGMLRFSAIRKKLFGGA